MDTPLVEVRSISKSYGAVQAVREVSLSIRSGEVHSLVGENGAGKSTLGKIIAGIIPQGSGELLVDGQKVAFHSPRQALAHGIATIAQELTIVPSQSVLENVFIGNEQGRWALHRPREQRRRYRELIEQSGFDLDPDVPAGMLPTGQQQLVEILRALARDVRLIIMDEPTARLSDVEAERLHRIIRGLREQGKTIVFISHRLGEVLELSDTVSVMRDGALIRSVPASTETVPSLVKGMLGQSLDAAFPTRQSEPELGDRVLTVTNLCSAGRFEDVSFSVAAGEIVGFAGLVGSGRTEVARAVFGLDRFDEGTVELDGRRITSHSPQKLIQRGLTMLPESRKDDGLVLNRSITENLTMASPVSRWGFVRRSAERMEVLDLMEQLRIRASGPAAPVATLSGGNQQKVLFGRMLTLSPRVAIIDEPTRGVDVGAKRAIYDLILALATKGVGIVVISSELEEVLGISDRVIVMREGRVAAELAGPEAHEEAVLAAAFGSTSVHDA